VAHAKHRQNQSNLATQLLRRVELDERFNANLEYAIGSAVAASELMTKMESIAHRVKSNSQDTRVKCATNTTSPVFFIGSTTLESSQHRDHVVANFFHRVAAFENE
jgi:hypothetical protein